MTTPAGRLAALLLALPACSVAPEPSGVADALPAIAWAPRGYVCYRAESPPTIDGRLDEPAWRAAPATDDFVDIVGPSRPAPRYATRVRMLWDDRCLYVAAEMEEARTQRGDPCGD